MTEIEEGAMGYKEIAKNLSFADLAVSKSLENNRSLKMMEKINKVVKWKNIEALLMEHYEVGKSEEGADAYPPVMLLKCMLLQKWFPSGLEAYGPEGEFLQTLNLRTRLMTVFLSRSF
jgi:hypothetical protein